MRHASCTQALLSRLESQIGDYQREKQLRDHRRQAVDVQVIPALPDV